MGSRDDTCAKALGSDGTDDAWNVIEAIHPNRLDTHALENLPVICIRLL